MRLISHNAVKVKKQVKKSIAVILSACFACEGSAENWHMLSSAPGIAVEIELDSYRNFIVYKEAWIRLRFTGDYPRNGKGEQIFNTKMHVRIDCIRRRALVDSVSTVTSAGLVKKEVAEDNQIWVPVDPEDPILSKAYDYGCKL
jgi:hypothetical protein